MEFVSLFVGWLVGWLVSWLVSQSVSQSLGPGYVLQRNKLKLILFEMLVA
jgi:hypothetical protein